MRSSFRSGFVYHALALVNRLSLSPEFILLYNLGAQVVSYSSGHLRLSLIQCNCILKDGGKPVFLHSSCEHNFEIGIHIACMREHFFAITS